LIISSDKHRIPKLDVILCTIIRLWNR